MWFRSPKKTSPKLEKLLESFRKAVPPVEHDRVLQKDIAAAAAFVDSWSQN